MTKELKASCNNCESQYQQYGKLCPWRSISGDYCFDGMNAEEAQREIKKNIDDFQTKIARGLVDNKNSRQFKKNIIH